MSLKSLFVVALLVAVLLFGVVSVAAAQESKGAVPGANEEAPRTGMPEVVESNQVVERAENGVSQGNGTAAQNKAQVGPCGPACRKNMPLSTETPVVVVTPTPTITPTPTVITTTKVVTVTVYITVEVEIPCPTCPAQKPCTIEYNEASCPLSDVSVNQFSEASCPMPEIAAEEPVAEIPFWVLCCIALSCLVGGAAVFYSDRRNNA